MWKTSEAARSWAPGCPGHPPCLLPTRGLGDTSHALLLTDGTWASRWGVAGSQRTCPGLPAKLAP